jgi:hypothetical protein
MKYIITFSIALAFSMSAMAQTGLVFNQCLTLGGQTNVNTPSEPLSVTYFVPEGKVWKIEYAHVDQYTTSQNKLLINNTVACLLSSSITHFPIWAKAGDEIKFRSGQWNADYFLSVLEFNVN